MRQFLLDLGNRLVERHSYRPWAGPSDRSTDPLLQFLCWLDRSPEARQEVENLGFTFERKFWAYGRPEPALTS